MTLKLQLLVALRCLCCGQMLNDEQRTAAIIQAAFFGITEPYQVCPVCLQLVTTPELHDPEYRRKARVEMYTRYGVVIREHWSPTYAEPPVEMDPPIKRRRRTPDEE